ncbi:MAG TPA: undecaprenyl-diphosphate phosphatase, partial [Planctomycetaceae bacterium]|nr:undecaprenyl-diphosphate phosphatase [Planctomycetaceae bacterium]
ALWLLVRWLEKGKLHYFAYWCIPLGILIVIMQLT